MNEDRSKLTPHNPELNSKPEVILIEERLGRRIASDVSHILKQGWADEISESDFNHGHLCAYGKPPIGFNRTGYEALRHTSIPDVHKMAILYHTHELDRKASLKRNIISHFGYSPTVVNSRHAGKENLKSLLRERERIKTQGTCTVGWQDLDLTLFCDIEFRLNNKGKYQLSDGRRIDIYAVADGAMRDRFQRS